MAFNIWTRSVISFFINMAVVTVPFGKCENYCVVFCLIYCFSKWTLSNLLAKSIDYLQNIMMVMEMVIFIVPIYVLLTDTLREKKNYILLIFNIYK